MNHAHRPVSALRCWGLIASLAFLVVGPALADIAPAPRPIPSPATAPTTAPRFAYLDIWVDSGTQPLAAWQLELSATDRALVVGVEGGEHRAYSDAPFYDPAALGSGRIIIAAFSTAADLPTGRTRVARIHLRVPAEGRPAYAVKLVTAGSKSATPIPATASFTEGKAP